MRDVGYLYVVEFSTGVVKIGKAINPKTRIAAHVAHAERLGLKVTRTWSSSATEFHSRAESDLIDICKRRRFKSTRGYEYFSDLPFEEAQQLAFQCVANLAERIAS